MPGRKWKIHRLPAWKAVATGGAIILFIGLGLTPVLENVVYSPPDFESLDEGTYVVFAGTVKSNKRIAWMFGVAYELEIGGFDGVVLYKQNDFQIGEKVLVQGYYENGHIKGRIPGVIIVDGIIPADVSRVWWPAVSQYVMLIGAVLVLSGAINGFFLWKKKPAPI